MGHGCGVSSTCGWAMQVQLCTLLVHNWPLERASITFQIHSLPRYMQRTRLA